MLSATMRPTCMNKQYINGGLGILVLVIVAIGCSKIANGKSVAENAITDFHTMLDDGKFSEIYAASDQRMKDEASEAEMIKVFKAVHSKLGSVKKTTNQNWSVKNSNLTSYIEMIQDTEFENGKGSEKFTYFFVDDKTVLLGGYYITSNDLITD